MIEQQPARTIDSQQNDSKRDCVRANKRASEDERASMEELQAFRQQLGKLDVFEDGLQDVGDGFLPPRIGRFEIQDELGRGSYGTVYVAYDPKLSRNVAVKIAHVGTHLDERARKLFFAEAHAAARLGHPNVVTVHEYGEEAGLLYIVYQLCVGPTLDNWLAERPDRVAAPIAVEIVRQIAKGLSHAHKRGIVHRDVKPSNIVLQEADDATRLPADCPISFEPRITDFGLAHDLLSFDQRSREDGLVGTIDYMSPEQIQDEKSSRSATSDIYSLGVLLYRMLTGVLPSQGSNTLEILQQICSVEPLHPRDVHSEVPRDLAAVCLKCLAKTAKQRYQSCEELIEDLDSWKSGEPVSARRRSMVEAVYWHVSKSPVVCALTCTVVLICLVSAGALSHVVSKQRKLLSQGARNEQALSREIEKNNQAKENLQKQRDELVELNRRTIDASYRADMRLAYADYGAGRLRAVHDTLGRVTSNLAGIRLPGFDYELLRARLESGPRELVAHLRAANDALVIPNTKLVATSGNDGRIAFHDVVTGEVCFVEAELRACNPQALAISADGTQLAVGWKVQAVFDQHISYVRVYDFNELCKTKQLPQPQHEFAAAATVQSLAFSPDGKRLAIGARYAPIAVWYLEREECLTVKTTSRNRSVEFSVDGDYLLITDQQDHVLIVDAVDGNTVSEITCYGPQVARLSPDGKWIAVGEYNSPHVRIFANDEWAAHEKYHVAVQTRGVVASLCWAPDSSALVAGTQSGGIVAWSLPTSIDIDEIEPQLSITPHAASITALQVIAAPHASGDSMQVVSTDEAGQVFCTPLQTELQQRSSARTFDVVGRSFCEASSVETLLAGLPDGSLYESDTAGRLLQSVLPSYPSQISAIATSPDARHVAVGWADGRLAMLHTRPDGRTTLVECLYPEPSDSLDERRINSIQFSPDSKMLAAAGDDARIRLWRVADGSHPIWERTQLSLAYSVCFIGSSQVACGGMFEEIAIYDCQTGKRTAMLGATSRATALWFDEDRGLLFSGHQDGQLRVHSTANWQLEHTLGDSVDSITCLLQSPCGGVLLVGSENGRLSLWDCDTKQIIGNLQCSCDDRKIQSMQFSGNHLVLLTACGQLQDLQLAAKP
ncbi:MAG: WD40 repeat domain-containing serine/threonine-protein kinase [Pirellulaceae bacterium]